MTPQDIFTPEQLQKIDAWRMQSLENMGLSDELAWRAIQKEELEKRSMAEKEAIFRLQNKDELRKFKELNELRGKFLEEIKNKGFSEEDIQITVKFGVKREEIKVENDRKIDQANVTPEDLVVEAQVRYRDRPFYYYYNNYTEIEDIWLEEGLVKLGVKNFFEKYENEVMGYDIRGRVKENDSYRMASETHARALLRDQRLIPKEWQDYYLMFPGTLWEQKGRLYMPFLEWNGKRWELQLGNLISRWRSHGRVVLVRE